MKRTRLGLIFGTALCVLLILCIFYLEPFSSFALGSLAAWTLLEVGERIAKYFTS